MYRPYVEVLTPEEKLAKAKVALKDAEALTAHLDDRQKEQFFKLLHKKMGLQYGDMFGAEWALEQKTKAHLRRVVNR